MNLFDKLNRLDDSLVESKKIVKKQKLTENLSANEYELVYHQNTACRDRRPETVDDIYDDWTTSIFRADSNLDAWKEAFERVTGDSYDDYLDKDASEEDFINYFEDSAWGDGSPILIKLSSSDSDLYNTGYTLESWIDEFVEQDYDDDIDEMLTEMFVDELFVEGASEVYYLELFSKDGRTFEQSFSTYQEAEEEGNFSLENNPLTKEYIIYDKNHKRVKYKR